VEALQPAPGRAAPLSQTGAGELIRTLDLGRPGLPRPRPRNEPSRNSAQPSTAELHRQTHGPFPQAASPNPPTRQRPSQTKIPATRSVAPGQAGGGAHPSQPGLSPNSCPDPDNPPSNPCTAVPKRQATATYRAEAPNSAGHFDCRSRAECWPAQWPRRDQCRLMRSTG